MICATLWLVLGFTTNPLLACGPDFPNNLLGNGGDAVLVAPRTDFYCELNRLHLMPPRFHAVMATNTCTEQNIMLEAADLLTALKKAGTDDFAAGQIADAHLAERLKLQEFNAALNQWSNSVPAGWDINTGKYVRGLPTTPPPPFPVINVVAGLPEEFGDYFDGAIAWNNPLILNRATCRQMWERLLALPPEKRPFKSVAATFMLGKSWSQEDPDKAAGYFQQVRVLAKRGFADSAGLAAASFGAEARLDLDRKQFVPAISLYLEQLATGDRTAPDSLRFAAARALASDNAEVLNQLAVDAKARRVITAYLISRCSTPGLDRLETANRWLAAVEAANVREVESAEEFALAAYQAGEWELSQRWIDRAPNRPTAQWLQVKLLLRAGKTDEAAALLATVRRSFPVEPPTTNAPATLAEDLTVAKYGFWPGDREAASQVLGEIGVLHLVRREYTESLDALLRSGFWMDAAYVAERVLTVDELKTYVDENWPAVADTRPNLMEPNDDDAAENGELHPRPAIRYLLARRLTRLERGAEAGAYYPIEWRAAQAKLRQQLAIGRNDSLPDRQRFYALVAAAHITRTNGMELIGTEVAPDWHIPLGNYEAGVTADSRRTGTLPATQDELDRAAQNDVVPETRWHYRDQAAALKVEAAKLGWTAAAQLPENSEEAARLLCRSGSWLDPNAAAKYYQAILHRCRNTQIGAETARIGDFPKLDANGHVIRRKLNAEDQPVPGKAYVIHAGDTLTQIAALASETGWLVTVADIVQANRNLLPDKIRAGRTIDIPVPGFREHDPTPSGNTDLNPPAEYANAGRDSNDLAAGERYVIQIGDSLAAIARAASSFGWQVSVQDILEANPGLNSTKIRVGQVILIPMPRN